jgi:hypothetical protein
MSNRVFEFTIKVFWEDDNKYSDDLIETFFLKKRVAIPFFTFSITFVSLLMYP